MKRLYIASTLLFIVLASCFSSDEDKSVSNSNALGINLPDGFKIEVFAEVDNARSLAVSPSGVVYVGNRASDKVYALRDTDGDWKADEKFVIASGLNMPNGVAFKDGALYVAEVSKIWKYPNIEADLNNPPKPQLITDDYPTEGHHGWKYIAFGPDGKLYVPVGAPCNICESDEIYASITRINPDGSNREIVAHGVRNTVGFDWHPDTNELWFTDNGRDRMGDEFPPCELNKISSNGQHFGYPYCHGGDIADPEFGSKRHCNDFVRPQYNFRAHTAPLGMTFYTGEMFPAEYKGDIFVAQHGSWNRSTKIGYRVMRVKVENNRAVDAEVFADGWLNDATQNQTGRPVDVLQMADGSLLLSDDYGNKVYRISYE
ncbi:PQQ-dependent sugar dehydrogenase [Fulvivirga lutea]|uniref:Sorbosone dehydrogenase family protein n=1 Tax=Fulvivirga lutea TaxID=2810512 RepID=A0A975A2P3_9BACT|nr:sorbosone dehydrogenase family protein [Fulvivirga lutea]QSE99056.1 sorbosone dehydrogenase family protein [Fulvivirga lutea]